MARDFATVNLSIWNDPDFLALPPAPQHLYMALWTSPGLSYCGVHDWRPGRLAARASGWTGEHIRTIADCLIARHFLVIDEDTEEVLVRSWARFDGILRKPRMAVSYVMAYGEVASQTLRMVLANETRKIREESPDLSCWEDSRVSALLSYPAISAKDLPTPDDPFADGFRDRFASGLPMGLPIGLPQTDPKVCPSVYLPPTPAPAPAPYTNTPLGPADKSTGKSKRQLPDDWKPNDQHLDFAAEKHLDIEAEAEQFTDHHRAKGSVMKDWDAAFRTWMRNAVKWRKDEPAPSRNLAHLPHVDELEAPPSGLSEAEYSAWNRAQIQKRKAPVE